VRSGSGGSVFILIVLICSAVFAVRLEGPTAADCPVPASSNGTVWSRGSLEGKSALCDLDDPFPKPSDLVCPGGPAVL